ncbi:hypothetical protein BH09PLA1_BH09PLA1_04470 [soil metagenome]
MKLGLRLFFLVGFVVPTVALYLGFLQPLWLTLSARSWIETPATIIAVNVIESGDKLKTWKTDVLYTYEIDGQQFMSNQYNPTECSVPNDSLRRQAISSYSAGQSVHCFVDPGDSSRATLTRHISPSLAIGVWVVLFMVLFGVGTFAPNLDKLDNVSIKSAKAVLVIGAMLLMLVIGTGVALLARP